VTGHETTDSQTDKENISGKMITTNLPTQGNSWHRSKLFAWKLFLFEIGQNCQCSDK